MASRPTFLVVNFLYLGIVGSMVYTAYHYGGEASIVSLVIGIPTLIMILFAIGSRLLNEQETKGKTADFDELATAPWSRAMLIAAWLAGFFLMILCVGFFTSIPVYTLAFLKFEGKISWLRALATAACLWAVLYLSFDYLMGQELFQGIAFRALLPNL